MYRYNFTVGLTLEGVYLADIDCAANVRVSDDDGDWYVESWVVYGVDAGRWQNRHREDAEVEISRSPEKDHLKEVLRRAIDDEWFRNHVVYKAGVESMISGDADDRVPALPLEAA